MNAIKLVVILSVLVLVACQSHRNNGENRFATPLMQSEQSLPTISEVLLYRKQVCQSDKDKQEQWLQQYRAVEKSWVDLERLKTELQNAVSEYFTEDPQTSASFGRIINRRFNSI